MKKILAFTLTLVMLFTSVVSLGISNASAIAGGGLPDKNNLHYAFGCDLSTWNVDGADTLNYSLVDFNKMKADGCEFAILRIALEYSSGGKDIDKACLEYYKRARAAGMQLGAYFYSHSTTYAGAKADAQYVIDIIEKNDLYFEYPIYYDVEESDQTSLSKTNFTNLCLGWCETMEANGYLPGVYATVKNINNKLTADFKSKYETWGAWVKTDKYTGSTSNQYSPYDILEDEDAGTSYYAYEKVGMWQYAFYDYEYDGIGLDMLDVNVCYKDYPAITAQYGYNNCEIAEPNLVSGKTPITSSGAPLAAPNASYTASLTDGKAAAISQIDTAGTWFAIKDGVNTANGLIEIFFDLGARYDISDISLHLGNYTDYGISSPYELKFAVSDSLTSDFTYYSEQFPVKDSRVAENAKVDYWSEIKNVSGITGRYLKITGNLGSTWFMINEVKVNGTINTDPVISGQGSLVKNKTGKISGVGTTMGDYTANLTDGIAGNDVYVANEWFAFKNDLAEGVEPNTANSVNGVGSVVYDLGKSYNVTRARVHLGYNMEWGVANPWGVSISVSNDGVNFRDTKEFTVVKAEAGDAYATWIELKDLTNFAGQYVKISVGINGRWAFLNEIEVYGDEHTCTPGVMETVKEPEIGVEGLKQQCCTVCQKVLKEEKIPALEEQSNIGDVYLDGKLNITDYIVLKQVVLGTKTLEDLKEPETAFDRCNVFQDSKIDAKDYFRLKAILIA